MKRSTNLAWSELRVGLILVAALLVGTVAVTSFSGIREYFRPTFPLTTRFSQVSGLKPGAVVMLSGVLVGNVKDLAIPPGKSPEVEVTMAIYTARRKDIRADAEASLGSQGLLGDKYIEIAPGSPDQPPVAPGGRIAGTTPTDFTQVVDQAQDAADRLGALLDEVTALAKAMRKGEGTAGRLVTDPALYDQARDAAGALSDTAKELSETARAYRDLGARISQMTEADGTMHRLTTDPEPFERLTRAMGHLDAVLAKVEAGEGTLGRAVNDPELADEVTGLVKDLRGLVQDVQKHPDKYVRFTLF